MLAVTAAAGEVSVSGVIVNADMSIAAILVLVSALWVIVAATFDLYAI